MFFFLIGWRVDKKSKRTIKENPSYVIIMKRFMMKIKLRLQNLLSICFQKRVLYINLINKLNYYLSI